MKKFVYLLITVLVLLSCNKENPIKVKKIELPQGSEQIVKANNKFGIIVFQNIISEAPVNTNFMFSPLSLHTALSMALNGAAGSTSEEIINTLELSGSSVEQINDCYKTLIDELITVDDKVIFSIANSMWYDQNFDVKEEFIKKLKDYYSAEVQELDFGNSGSVKAINDWVKDKTNGKIEKIIDQLSPDEVLALINALYFNGKWHSEFEESSTIEEDFTIGDNSIVQVPTMIQKQTFKIGNSNKYTMVEMPYGQGNFAMDLFLPENGFTLNDVLDTLKSFDAIVNDMIEQEIEIHLPKFEYESEYNLGDILKMMGMPLAFSDNADFSNISEQHLQISRVIQKTYIKVEEKGTEAAAVTFIGFETESIPIENPVIKFDRPFIYVIREVSTNTIIFIGIVSDPR